MFRPRVIPVLLLKNLGLVKTVKFGKSKYIGDPINAVKIFNDLKADELVFLDISATAEDHAIPLGLISQISEEAFMPFSVGGGIKNIDDINKIIEQGAEKVVLNTHALSNPNIIKESSEYFGSQSITISIDVKKNMFGEYAVFTHNGKVKADLDIIDWVKQVSDLGAGEIIINSIDNDGIMNGYDLKLIEIVSSAVSIPVVSCGGAGSFKDFNLAINHGAHAVAAGSFFVYHGPRNAVLINYPNNEELLNIFYKDNNG